MTDREKIIRGLEHCIADNCDLCPYDENVDCPGFDPTPKTLLADALALLKAQEPNEDWISRKRLKDEIQYYIDEAGWGDEVNKVLVWCLEFIDNQRAVKWDD